MQESYGKDFSEKVGGPRQHSGEKYYRVEDRRVLLTSYSIDSPQNVGGFLLIFFLSTNPDSFRR